jgi:hypothetical protein
MKSGRLTLSDANRSNCFANTHLAKGLSSAKLVYASQLTKNPRSMWGRIMVIGFDI